MSPEAPLSVQTCIFSAGIDVTTSVTSFLLCEELFCEIGRERARTTHEHDRADAVAMPQRCHCSILHIEHIRVRSLVRETQRARPQPVSELRFGVLGLPHQRLGPAHHGWAQGQIQLTP